MSLFSQIDRKKKLREIAIKKGNCHRCFKPKKKDKFKLCKKCRDYQKRYRNAL